MAGDRIGEAYEGKLSEFMRESSRKRIDWFCDQVKGEDVLDIGCSQGILPILIGRKGISVIGLDNDKESIAYAKNSLENEELFVREKVYFICDDFLEYDFGDRKFDTIIMGEVLEHLFNPLLFLKKASELLKKDGLFIASVPFGLNRHPDHKRTYFFHEFYEQIDAYFCVEKVVFMGKWIAMIAASKENEFKNPIELNDMYPRLENALYNLEEIREKEKSDLKEKLLQSNELAKKLKEEKAALQNKVSDLEIKLKEEKAAFQNKVSDYEKKLEETETVQKKAVIELEKKYEAELEGLKNRQIKELEEAEKAYTEEIKNYTVAIEKFERDTKIYKRKLNESKLENKRLEKRYLSLKTSKLGSLQIKYWTLRSAIKRKFSEYYLALKKTAKKSPLLCSLVWNHRDKKIQKKNQEIKQLMAPDSGVKKAESKKIEAKAAESKKPALNAAQKFALFEEKTDKNFFDTIKDVLENIPESNGGRFYKKHNYKIGIIADEFLYAAFKDAADFVFITPENWEDVVNETDFLIMVSAWRGLHEEWRGAAQEGSEKRDLIYKIIKKYKEQKKTTVFYSKEDPPNYDSFIGIAKKCDYIFTSCAEVVENYKNDCFNDNVDVLCFAINPLYHNPVGIKNPYKKDGVIFSGSWMRKYPERLIDMHMLFSGVLECGKPLKIVDRNYTRGERYRYPEEYWQYVSPEIEHTYLQKVHKLYNWALNVNSVTKSMTMFANRGYELQAAGNLLISNYSMGLNDRLPMVYTVTDKSEVGAIINGYTDEEIYERQIAGVRSVMTGETAFDRVGKIIETIGFERNAVERSILVVADELTDKIKEMFENQSYRFKKLISLDAFTQEELENSDMTAFFKSGMDYGMFYLEDMSNGFKYTNSSYITKDSFYDGDILISGKEHDYVSVVKNKYATIFWNSDFNVEQLKNMDHGAELENGYSIDHFNYNQKEQTAVSERSYKLSVIVPVYNNGKRLMGKAFSSLQRSSMFEDMEILLIDDGSTDEYTDKLVKHLAKRYPNVKAYFFADGGSGSAARSRKEGVELASAAYVTYLDPQNEAIFDGYAKLCDLSMEGGYDITVGNMLKLTTEISDAKYYENFKKYGSDLIDDDAKTYLEKTNSCPMSIQAMVIKKSIVLDNQIIQSADAAERDARFYSELFLDAKKIKGISLPVYIHYDA